MKLIFKQQPYQTDATMAVVRCFEGQGKEIRKTIHNNEWWFSVADVVVVLTDSADPRQYLKKMRRRDPVLDSNWGTICTPLWLETSGCLPRALSEHSSEKTETVE